MITFACTKYKLIYYSNYLGTLGSLNVGGGKIVGAEGRGFLKFNR